MDQKIIIIGVVMLVILFSSSVSSIIFFMNQSSPTSEAAPSPAPPTPAPTPTPAPEPTPAPTQEINAREGDAISCTGYNPRGEGAIYRYLGNKSMSWYPNPSIAELWDKNWRDGASRKLDCTGFKLEKDMQAFIKGQKTR